MSVRGSQCQGTRVLVPGYEGVSAWVRGLVPGCEGVGIRVRGITRAVDAGYENISTRVRGS